MRVLTYNVHGCVGADGRLSPERIAEVIRSIGPDVACLQEVDAWRPRSGGRHQAQVIAEALGMHFQFHPAWRQEKEEYGEATLSRFPMELVRVGELPTVPRPVVNELRAVLWVRVQHPHGPCHVLNTHLGLGRAERHRQAVALLGSEWAGAATATGEPFFLCGDFNSVPVGTVHRLLRSQLGDCQGRFGQGRYRPTFPTRWPVLCLDHIFLSPQLTVEHTEAPRTSLTRWASDHLPLWTEAAWPPP